MKKYKVLFCDLDDTLIETLSGKTFPKGIWDMKIKFDVLDAIKQFSPEYVLIVSNQGGIEAGFVDHQRFQSKIEYVSQCVKEYCGVKCYSEYCTTNDKNDLYRKPNVGILNHLCENYVGNDFDYIKSVTLMIGDASGLEGQFSDSDKRTAENFGIDYLDVNEFVNLYNKKK
jgi:DNA 3'-phosphatase